MSGHSGPIFKKPEDRLFAYQDEYLRGGGWLNAWDSSRPEPGRYISRGDIREFDLYFAHHTNHSLTVTLEVKHEGKTIEKYEFGGSFAELCNRIFAPGCEKYEEPL